MHARVFCHVTHYIKRKQPMESSCRIDPICRSVGRSVRKVYCGKTADCIRMQSVGMVSEVDQGMSALDGGGW